jgi:hypothetical protein
VSGAAAAAAGVVAVLLRMVAEAAALIAPIEVQMAGVTTPLVCASGGRRTAHYCLFV